MKKAILLFTLVPFIFLNACKKDKNSFTLPDELVTWKSSIQLSIDSLNNELTAAATSLAQTGVDSILVRNKLIQLYSNSSFTKEFCFVNSQYILQLIEPPQYYQYQGTDFSNDPNFTLVFQSKQPALSTLFHAVEGFDAVADMHPVVSGGQSIGLLESVFVPSELLGRIALPLLANKTVELWAIEKNGMMLYNQDTIELGRNVFSDPYYASFTSFKEACQKIVDSESGETTYSFYQTGTTTVVTKKTYWDTITIHGTEWRIVWVKPE